MSEKYAFIEAEHATVAGETACAPAVTQMCGWLRVSRSGFYEWRSRPESAAAKRRNELKLLIAKAFEDSDGTYGYRRIADSTLTGRALHSSYNTTFAAKGGRRFWAQLLVEPGGAGVPLRGGHHAAEFAGLGGGCGYGERDTDDHDLAASDRSRMAAKTRHPPVCELEPVLTPMTAFPLIVRASPAWRARSYSVARALLGAAITDNADWVAASRADGRTA